MNETTEKYKEIPAQINNLQSKLNQLDDNLKKSDLKYSDLLSTNTNNSNLTSELEKQLNDLAKNIGKTKSDAEELIDSAREALDLCNAHGISAAMHEQYRLANKLRNKLPWLIFAVFFIAITLGIGFEAALHSKIWDVALFKITLLPITIYSAWFCANRYSKQKEICEDYAYKTTIAKSFVGFYEKLNNQKPNEEQAKVFLSNFVEEITKSPVLHLHDKKLEKNKENK